VSSSSTEKAALVDVTMPQMGVSVAEGTIVAWRVEVGDRIEAEQTICEISTDKIDTEVPAPVTGVVAEIVVPVETTVDVGTVLARIATEDGVAAGACASRTCSRWSTATGTAREWKSRRCTSRARIGPIRCRRRHPLRRCRIRARSSRGCAARSARI
jgi:pyruvate/2-oxoglutarate dehydrogenase complex dihydrolipoamide acyltransferase (E2) component